MALQAPITHADHVTLRAAVLELKENERRRVFGVAVHAGVPGVLTATHRVPPGPGADHGLRTDLASALLLRAAAVVAGPRAWLTRPGALALHDADVAWSSAFAAAGAEAGLAVDFVVVTRDGWFDPVSGVRREWRRLRRRSSPLAADP